MFDASKRLPKHVAIIMDGNGRWAQREGKPNIEGHRKGAEVARVVVRKLAEIGVSFLTLYTFSSENWLRPLEWVNQLMSFLRTSLKKEGAEFARNNIRLKVIGELQRLPQDILELLQTLEHETAFNTGLTLLLALSYGARDELTQAAQKIAQAVIDKQLAVADIKSDTIESFLYTANIPDPDLLIRTSGENRVSNFLLWQLAYSELMFFDCLWPDFTMQDLEKALAIYSERERRFGSVFGKFT